MGSQVCGPFFVRRRERKSHRSIWRGGFSVFCRRVDLLELGERVGDSANALAELLFAGGVGESDVAFGAESGSCYGGHVADCEEVHGEVA